MNKAQYLLQLTEKWAVGFKHHGIYIEIFEDPDRRELEELGRTSTHGEIRFAADSKTKKLYVWDADLAVHPAVLEQLGFSRDEWRRGHRFLLGTASKRGGQWVFFESDRLNTWSELIPGTFKHDWGWVNRSINVTNYLSRLQGKSPSPSSVEQQPVRFKSRVAQFR